MRAFFQRLHDRLAGDQVTVHQVRPVGDLVNASSVLLLHRLSNIGELSVLKDQKSVLSGQLAELLNKFSIEVVY